jgi:hypothetical protein
MAMYTVQPGFYVPLKTNVKKIKTKEIKRLYDYA